LGLIRPDRSEIPAAAQRLTRGGRVQTCVDGQIDELLLASEVPPLGEVGRHEALHKLQLQALLLGEVQQLVGAHGVRVLEQVEPVLETGLGGDPGHALQHLLRVGGVDPLVVGEVVRLAALEVDGRVGREFERAVRHLDARWVLVGG